MLITMKTLLYPVIILTALLLPEIVICQRQIPVKVSFVTEQIALPTFQKYGGQFGFGFSTGSEFIYSVKKKMELAQTADFYFISHKQYGTSSMLASLFALRYKPGSFNIDFKLGPGYLLFRNYSPVYKEINGKYEKKSNLQSKFAGLASLSVSYTIQQVKPFISYNVLVETPFISSSSALLPHHLLEIGLYYNLNLKKHEK